MKFIYKIDGVPSTKKQYESSLANHAVIKMHDVVEVIIKSVANDYSGFVFTFETRNGVMKSFEFMDTNPNGSSATVNYSFEGKPITKTEYDKNFSFNDTGNALDLIFRLNMSTKPIDGKTIANVNVTNDWLYEVEMIHPDPKIQQHLQERMDGPFK